MTWGGLDQRAFPRFSVECDILIEGKAGQPIRAKTENLGAGGVCVILKEALEKLTHVRLRLNLDKKTPAIECDGRVIWTVPSKEFASKKVTFDTGVEFLNLPPETGAAIMSFIKNTSPQNTH